MIEATPAQHNYYLTLLSIYIGAQLSRQQLNHYLCTGGFLYVRIPMVMIRSTLKISL